VVSKKVEKNNLFKTGGLTKNNFFTPDLKEKPHKK